jgi:hypothetical protein
MVADFSSRLDCHYTRTADGETVPQVVLKKLVFQLPRMWQALTQQHHRSAKGCECESVISEKGHG